MNVRSIRILPSSSGRHHFRLLMSFRIALLSIVSARGFFSFAFSSSSAFSRRASLFIGHIDYSTKSALVSPTDELPARLASWAGRRRLGLLSQNSTRYGHPRLGLLIGFRLPSCVGAPWEMMV